MTLAPDPTHLYAFRIVETGATWYVRAVTEAAARANLARTCYRNSESDRARVEDWPLVPFLGTVFGEWATATSVVGLDVALGVKPQERRRSP